MKPRKTAYIVHRWLGLIVALQLLAWSVGGLMFSVLHIDEVRGERDIGAPMFDPIPSDAIQQLPTTLAEVLESLDAQDRGVGSITLVNRGVGPRWEVRDVHGDLLAAGPSAQLLTAEQAGDLALRDFAPQAQVASAQLLTTDPPVEYRNGSLPAYQVVLDHPKNPHIYIDARTGEVTARRNDKWRTFDFFWMLHTMDYRGRDNFNHLLLTVFSIVAITTASSGLLLWIWRMFGRLKRRRAMGTI